MAFSTFIVLCKHHLSLVPKHVITPRRPCPREAVASPLPLSPSPRATTLLSAEIYLFWRFHVKGIIGFLDCIIHMEKVQRRKGTYGELLIFPPLFLVGCLEYNENTDLGPRRWWHAVTCFLPLPLSSVLAVVPYWPVWSWLSYCHGDVPWVT